MLQFIHRLTLRTFLRTDLARHLCNFVKRLRNLTKLRRNLHSSKPLRLRRPIAEALWQRACDIISTSQDAMLSKEFTLHKLQLNFTTLLFLLLLFSVYNSLCLRSLKIKKKLKTNHIIFFV